MECSLEIIPKLEALIEEKEKEGWLNLRLDIEAEDYPFGVVTELYLAADREETDEEYERRLEKNKKERERAKAKKAQMLVDEKKLYKKLKKKFEGKK